MAPRDSRADLIVLGMDGVRVHHESRRERDDAALHVRTQLEVDRHVLSSVCLIAVRADEYVDVFSRALELSVKIVERTCEALSERLPNRRLARTAGANELDQLFAGVILALASAATSAASSRALARST